MKMREEVPRKGQRKEKISWSYIRVIILAGILSLSCSTRVSEWVLVNILPEKYTLVYFHGGEITDGEVKQNESIKAAMEQANIQFRTSRKGGIPTPYYILYYRDRVFARYNSVPEIKQLCTSPLRRSIAAELLSGKLCVMLYLKTGDEEKDTKGWQALQKFMLTSPFREVITVVELNRDSGLETHFTNMLLHVEDDLKDIREPMLFGIFGRFKALEPLVAGGITEENIRLMVDYFTAECSCVIKDALPGTDILYAGSWDNPKPALVNAIIDANPSLDK